MTDWLPTTTPREAMLTAQVAELTAKLKWLCAGSGLDETTLSPHGAMDRITVPQLASNLTMPLSARVAGVLARGGSYKVFAETIGHAENLQVGYHVHGGRLVDELAYDTLADLHRKFILTLAERLKRGG